MLFPLDVKSWRDAMPTTDPGELLVSPDHLKQIVVNFTIVVDDRLGLVRNVARVAWWLWCVACSDDLFRSFHLFEVRREEITRSKGLFFAGTWGSYELLGTARRPTRFKTCSIHACLLVWLILFLCFY